MAINHPSAPMSVYTRKEALDHWESNNSSDIGHAANAIRREYFNQTYEISRVLGDTVAQSTQRLFDELNAIPDEMLVAFSQMEKSQRAPGRDRRGILVSLRKHIQHLATDLSDSTDPIGVGLAEGWMVNNKHTITNEDKLQMLAKYWARGFLDILRKEKDDVMALKDPEIITKVGNAIKASMSLGSQYKNIVHGFFRSLPFTLAAQVTQTLSPMLFGKTRPPASMLALTCGLASGATTSEELSAGFEKAAATPAVVKDHLSRGLMLTHLTDKERLGARSIDDLDTMISNVVSGSERPISLARITTLEKRWEVYSLLERATLLEASQSEDKAGAIAAKTSHLIDSMTIKGTAGKPEISEEAADFVLETLEPLQTIMSEGKLSGVILGMDEIKAVLTSTHVSLTRALQERATVPEVPFTP